MSDQDFRLEFDTDGTLHTRGRTNWREPICPVCQEPVRWCLDMASFTTGSDHAYAHARCVWTPEAFEREAHLILDTIGQQCLHAVLTGGQTWQRFKADAEQQTGLTWPEIKTLLDQRHANRAAA